MTLAQEEERAVHDWKVGGSCPTIPFLPILSLSLGKALNPHSLLGMLGGGRRGCVVRIGSYALVSLAQGNCEHEFRFNFLLQVFFFFVRGFFLPALHEWQLKIDFTKQFNALGI